MRFVLDEDVDEGVCRFLRRQKHECWTAPSAGLGGITGADDDDISVYGDEKDAIVVSHDQAAAERRKKHTFGQHIWLRCRQAHAVQVIEERFDELIGLLDQYEIGVFEVRPDSVIYHRGSWGDLDE